MNLETGREFGFTNPQDDPHLYATPPPGFSYSYDGTLVGVPRHRPTMPSFSHQQTNVLPSPTRKTLSSQEIRQILLQGTFLPNARGPGKVTYCDVCQKSGLKQSIAYNSYDICLNCAQRHQ